MPRRDFHLLVDDLERRFASRPDAFKWRTLFVVSLGYAGFLGWVGALAAIGLAALIGALYVPPEGAPWLIIGASFALAFAVWQAVQVLWSPLPPSSGSNLRPSEFPGLNQLLQRMRQRLRVPRIHRMVIDCDMNAGIQQHPRLGIFGWTRNTLHLGLPLLEILTSAEFEAVLAHEAAHLSAKHGKLFAWIYRVRGTWEALFARLQDPPKSDLSRFFRRGLRTFVEWYWPRFHAYFFVISRTHEEVADRVSAEVAGPDVAAMAIWKLDLCRRRLDEKFWVETIRLANDEAQPPSNIMQRMLDMLSTPPGPEDARRWSNETLNAITGISDTHPAFSERLKTIGVTSHSLQATAFPTPPQVSAATALFGDQLPSVRERVNVQWQTAVAEAWKARHVHAAALRRRMDNFTKSSATSAMDASALWEKAQTLLALEGPSATAPLLCQILELRPKHAAANLAFGQYLLEQGRIEGEEFVRTVLEDSNPALTTEACNVLAKHYQLTGQRERLLEIHDHLSGLQEDAAHAGSAVTNRDEFIEHGLDEHTLAAVTQLLEKQERLAEAYLVRKRLRRADRQPIYVLCVRSRPGLFGRSSATDDATLLNRLMGKVPLPGRVLVIVPQHGFKAVARKIIAQPYAQIFAR